MKKWLAILLLGGLVLSVAMPGVLPWSPFKVSPNVIRWVTQSEEGIYGYDVFRGDSKDGPFRKINADTILGVGTTDLPQRYEYSDGAIEAGTIYWYYIESVYLSGKRSRLTPVYASGKKYASFW